MPLAEPTGARHRTKQEFVYHTLRGGILRCDLKPNERLVIDELARKLDVSSIPVREALHVLQSEGLVINVPHVGATVAPVSRESIVDVFTVLEGLETMATRLVATLDDKTPLDTLAVLVDWMDAALESGDTARWADLNRQFHVSISALPGLPLLQEMTERVLDRWDRVRRYYVRGVLDHRVRQAQREHRDLLEAMRAGNLPATHALVRQHNQGALAAYLTYLNGNGS